MGSSGNFSRAEKSLLLDLNTRDELSLLSIYDCSIVIVTTKCLLVYVAE